MRAFECDAVLFDLDGVLVDSTPAVERVWRDWAEKRALDADHILGVAHGRRTAETIRLVAPHLDAEGEARELEKIESGNMDGVLKMEGAREMLAALPPENWAVVTSGTRGLATGRMGHLGLSLPRAFVTAEDVANGKPDPEAYLRGAELLGAPVERCVVVEDAPSGIRAAKMAGMSVVAFATTHGSTELSEADAVADSLASIRFAAEPKGRPGVPAGTPRLTLRVGD